MSWDRIKLCLKLSFFSMLMAMVIFLLSMLVLHLSTNGTIVGFLKALKGYGIFALVMVLTSVLTIVFAVATLLWYANGFDGMQRLMDERTWETKALATYTAKLQDELGQLNRYQQAIVDVTSQIERSTLVLRESLDPQKVADSVARAVSGAANTVDLTRHINEAVMKCEAQLTEQGLSIVMNSLPFHERFADFDDGMKVAYFNAMVSGKWNIVNKKVRSL